MTRLNGVLPLMTGEEHKKGEIRKLLKAQDEEQLRSLVKATIKTYEGFYVAKEVLRDLCDGCGGDLRPPSWVSPEYDLMTEVVNRVGEEGFREPNEGETDLQWLRAYLYDQDDEAHTQISVEFTWVLGKGEFEGRWHPQAWVDWLKERIENLFYRSDECQDLSLTIRRHNDD